MTRAPGKAYSLEAARQQIGVSRSKLMAMKAEGLWGEPGRDWWTIAAANRRGGVEYRFTQKFIDRLRWSSLPPEAELESIKRELRQPITADRCRALILRKRQLLSTSA